VRGYTDWTGTARQLKFRSCYCPHFIFLPSFLPPSLPSCFPSFLSPLLTFFFPSWFPSSFPSFLLCFLTSSFPYILLPFPISFLSSSFPSWFPSFFHSFFSFLLSFLLSFLFFLLSYLFPSFIPPSVLLSFLSSSFLPSSFPFSSYFFLSSSFLPSCLPSLLSTFSLAVYCSFDSKTVQLLNKQMLVFQCIWTFRYFVFIASALKCPSVCPSVSSAYVQFTVHIPHGRSQSDTSRNALKWQTNFFLSHFTRYGALQHNATQACFSFKHTTLRPWIDKGVQMICPHYVGSFDLCLTKYTMYLVYVRFGAPASKQTVVQCVWLTVSELDFVDFMLGMNVSIFTQ